MSVESFDNTGKEEQTRETRILLADDHPLMRQALKNILEKQPDFHVVGEAEDGESAVRLSMELVPDLVIMDIGMPKLNGLEATRQIKSMVPQIAILVLTVYDDYEHTLGILQAGAAGYLTKSVFGQEVVEAVRAISVGETVLSHEISQKIIKYAARHIAQPVDIGMGEKLTAREVEVLRLAASGLSNRDIASTLKVSTRTVKGYLAEIFLKLGAGSRTQAVINCLRAGILTMDDIQ